MVEIQKVDFSRFLQNQVFMLHSLIIAETATLTDEKLKAPQADYQAAFTEFDEALKVGGKNPLSIKLSELDTLLDQSYVGLSGQTRAMLGHFDSEKAEIAYNVDLILQKNGNPCRLPYLQEVAVIKNLAQDLNAYDNPASEDRPGELTPDTVYNRLSLIYVDGWVERMETLCAEFEALYASRNTQEAAKETGATIATRKKTDAAAQVVLRRINSLADVNGDAAYSTVINNINQLIDKERAVLAAHRTTTAKRNAKKKEEAGSGTGGGGADDERPGEL